MKMTLKKQNNEKNKKRPISQLQNLPFDQQVADEGMNKAASTLQAKVPGIDVTSSKTVDSDELENDDAAAKLAETFLQQGNKLAEDGNFRKALGKWESALALTPDRAVIHEQKAQLLLELGEAWNALKAASRATELEPTWGEAWITLGRTQLNFGEPDSAIESFDRALAIKPDSAEARTDRQMALHLVKRRKQLHSTGLSSNENRYIVGDKAESS